MTLPFEITAEQADAVARVTAWLEDPFAPGVTREPGVFRFFGYAGSGKSSLARSIAEKCAGRVAYAAYTAKAALVMRQKGCYGASTVHKLCYLPRVKCAQRLRELARQAAEEQDPDRRREILAEHEIEKANLARPSFTLNTNSELRDVALLVLDEVSMIGQQHGTDLLTFEVPILALGDPAQLPPVRDRGYFTDPRQEPDVLLREVHRQGRGSDVLALCTRARTGEELAYGTYGASSVVRRRDLSIADAAGFDQIIVGRNETRRQINAAVRAHLRRSGPVPVPGDRLVCTRNDYETGLLNGSQWEVLDCRELDSSRLELTISDGATGMTVEAHAALPRGEEVSFYELRDAQCFEYAYAVTCHKAQGSQWRSVCVVDEGDTFGADAWRWRYTSCSRAIERVTIVR